MGKVKVELNTNGIRELLKSQEVANACQAEAQKIAARCGSGYATDTKDMPTRQIASVYTTTKEALKDNLENNTLLHALGGSAVTRRTGKEVKGYYRTNKNGEKIFVQGYRRKT